MKNKLLPLIFVLGCYAGYSQVGIGKVDPHPSAQLEVFANDKGMLIPRVKLTSTTDVSTIKSGNVESLLVFNTETIADIVPGYYYWYSNKWNKFIISGESTSVITGQGLPGDKGEAGYPGDSVAMYVDSETGKVYVRDPKNPDKWVPLTSKNGIDGIAGATGAPGTAGSITTLDAIVKDPEGNIYAYVGTENTVAGRDAEWASKSPNWVKINGLDGRDGKDGIVGGNGAPGNKGEAGYPGDNVAMYIDNTTGTIYVRDPQNPDKWIPVTGKNGIDGIAGATGAPGTAGSITTLDAIVKDPAGNIYAYVGVDNTIAGRDAEWASKSINWVKINGLDGRDGKDGIIGGNGAPGNKGEAGYPGDNVAMYIDNTTGTVYVRDPQNPDKWIPLTGKNGIDGIAGVTGAPGTAGSITTLDAIVKDPSGNIYAYVGNDKTIAGRDAEWASKSPNWVKINGLDGRDGKDGILGGNGAPGNKGEAGYPGDNVAMYIDNTTGTVYVRDPQNPDKWIPLTGKNGIDGIAGATGAPGTAGSITTLDAIIKDPAGNIYAYVGNDNTIAGRDAEWASKSPNWVKINGLDGTNGITGATGAPGTAGSITTLDAIVKDPAGNIYAYVGDDNTIAGRDAEWASKSPNWVKINGLNGANGIAGATGEPGTAGSITTLDAIVKDPNGTIYAYVGTDKTVAGRDAEWASKSPNWVPLNGKNGLDGKNGIAGGDGAPGASGAPAIDESVKMYIDYSTGTIYVRDPQNPTNWIPANKETLTSLEFDKATNKLTYTNENKTANVIDLTEAIQAGETKTTLVHNPTANTLTYNGEGETSIINLADITTTTPETVLEVTGTGAAFKAATVNIVPSTVVGDVLTTSEAGKVAWKAPIKPNVLGIKVISSDYTVIEEDYTIIAKGLTGDITINLPEASANKGRVLVINQMAVANSGNPIVVNFNTDVIYSDAAEYSYIAASVFGGVTKGSVKLTLQSDGSSWYVITYAM